MARKSTRLERDYQADLIKRLRKMYPGCVILKNDSSYMQGIPDWTIFYRDRWAMLEIKRKPPRPGTSDFEPNQEWYLDEMDKMSYAACIFPENEKEVLNGLHEAFRA